MNIKDIAEMAGVSRATVSRYLNNGYVSSEKKSRIKSVIDRTGYVPSSQAQMLRTKKTHLIGVIIPRVNSETVSKILKGISQVLNANHYHMLVANTENKYEKELEYLRIFANDRVDGVIMMASVLTQAHHDLIEQMPVPVVVLGQEMADCSCIYHDDFHAIQEMTERMLQSGSRHLAYLGIREDDVAVGLQRRSGFDQALAAAGLDADRAVHAVCQFSIDSGYEQMKAVLAQMPALKGAADRRQLDGVVCATDNIASGALKALKEAGFCVPGQVRISGLGDSKIAALLSPSIATVHFYYEKSGYEAGEMIMEQIQKGMRMVKKLLLGYEIVAGNSL